MRDPGNEVAIGYVAATKEGGGVGPFYGLASSSSGYCLPLACVQPPLMHGEQLVFALYDTKMKITSTKREFFVSNIYSYVTNVTKNDCTSGISSSLQQENLFYSTLVFFV